MSTQLDLFGDATEQTSALATVLVRSHLRVTRGAGVQSKPSVASRAKSPETVGIHPETVGTADPEVYTGRCEHCGRTSSITPEYGGINQLLRGIACATCPLCGKVSIFTREGSPVPHNGTRTSKAAAKHMEQTGAAMTQEARVLAAVQASGSRGMTREDIHHATGISVASVCGRVNTLAGKGLLSETGETRMSSAGVMQAVVVAKEGNGA